MPEDHNAPNEETRISLGDGKYEVVHNRKEFYCTRHGEPWRDLTCDNLVLFLVYEIELLREKLRIQSESEDVKRLMSKLLTIPAIALAVPNVAAESLKGPLYQSRDEALAELNDAMSTLTNREQFVIRARFGVDGNEGRDLGSVGRKLKITRERVRQIEMKAVQKLREAMKKPDSQ